MCWGLGNCPWLLTQLKLIRVWKLRLWCLCNNSLSCRRILGRLRVLGFFWFLLAKARWYLSNLSSFLCSFLSFFLSSFLGFFFCCFCSSLFSQLLLEFLQLIMWLLSTRKVLRLLNALSDRLLRVIRIQALLDLLICAVLKGWCLATIWFFAFFFSFLIQSKWLFLLIWFSSQR